MPGQPHFPRPLSPLDVDPLTLRSRIIMGLMHSGLEDRTRDISKLVAYLGCRAEDGVGLIVTGGCAFNIEGWLTPVGSMMVLKRMADNHCRATDLVHFHGSRIVSRMLHTSRYSYSPLARSANIGQSPISPFKAHRLIGFDVSRTIGAYVRATKPAKRADYDGTEVMGPGGYLLSQFLVERTSHRSDNRGDSAEARMRLPIEIARRIRAEVGEDFLLQYRILLLDLVEDGQTWFKTIEFAQRLAETGADVSDTNTGWREVRIPTIITFVPRVAFMDLMGRLRSFVDVPVAISNRISRPEVAEKILVDGNADPISMARPLLADPDFAIRAGDGRADQISTRIACNQACLDHIFAAKRSTCLVNPKAAYETELVSVPVAKDKAKHVAVIGTGVVGPVFVEAAAQRGHHPEIFEAVDRIGGQFNLAAQILGKEDYGETSKYFSRRLEVPEVPVHLNMRADVDKLKTKFDHVIVATGITPCIPGTDGIDHEKVIRYDELLLDVRQAGNKVAVISAGGTGVDVCEHLTRKLNQTIEVWKGVWGVGDPAEFRVGLTKPGTVSGMVEESEVEREVHLLQRKTSRIGKGLGKTTGWVHRVKIKKAGIKQYTGVTYSRIDDEGLHATIDEKPQVIAVDNVIVRTGQVSNLDCLGGKDHENVTSDSFNVTVIGGVDVAAELDAKRAIHQVVEATLAL